MAFVSGAPALSNVVSFVWANLAHGRARIGLMVGLQAGFARAGGVVRRGAARARRTGLRGRVHPGRARGVDRHPHGARRGVERELSARGDRPLHRPHRHRELAGGGGWRRRSRPGRSTRQRIDSRWLFGAGAAAGLLAAWLYRAARVRREFALLAEENAAVGRTEPFSLGMLFEILRKDPHFREYMFWMGVFGGGNLMLTSQLVVIFSEHLHLVRRACRSRCCRWCRSALLPLFVPFWARMFDEGHIVEYRARQGWALVRGRGARSPRAPGSRRLPLLWLGAVLLGVRLRRLQPRLESRAQ